MKKKSNLGLSFLTFCICLVYFATPIESVGLFGDSSAFSIVKLTVILLLFAWLFFSHRRMDFNAITIPFVILGGYWLTSCLWSIDPDNSFRDLLSFYFPSIIMMLIIGGAVQSKQDINNILGAYLLGSIVLAVFCYINRDITLANATFEEMERVTALGQDQNELSFLLVMGLVIAFHGIQMIDNSVVKIALLLSALLFIYAILLTGSRTGAVMIVFVVLLFIWNNKKYSVFLLPAVVLLVPIIITQIPESTLDRIINIGQDIRTGNLSNREVIWDAGLTAFSQENVVLGVGYQNFTTMLRNHYGWSNASHNTYLSYLINGGIIGFAFLVFILTRLFVYCKRIVRSTRNSYWYGYLVPLILVMITLETQYRRWIFLIAILIFKAYEFDKRDSLKTA